MAVARASSRRQRRTCLCVPLESNPLAMIRGVLSACFACAALALSADPAAATQRCAEVARERAVKLATFHFDAPLGPTESIEIDKSVTELPPLRNPANPQQVLEVLEVWAYIYKAQYRMRFIFAPVPDTCALVGEEILEYGEF
jgi:hypothetical protein